MRLEKTFLNWQVVEIDLREKMKKTRQLGLALVIFGVIALIAVAFVYTVQQTVYGFVGPAMINYPYRTDAFPLILLTIVFFALGLILMVYQSPKK